MMTRCCGELVGPLESGILAGPRMEVRRHEQPTPLLFLQVSREGSSDSFRSCHTSKRAALAKPGRSPNIRIDMQRHVSWFRTLSCAGAIRSKCSRHMAVDTTKCSRNEGFQWRKFGRANATKRDTNCWYRTKCPVQKYSIGSSET